MSNTGQMTGRLLAGHRLMLGFDGKVFNKELEHIIAGIKAAGIILFKQNIASPDQVRALCRACQEYARLQKLPPLFIAVDQEGGTVARLRQGFTQFKGNSHIRTLADAAHFASITADELKDVGFNMNLAPVLDCVPEGVDSIMKDRAFPGDIHSVSKLGIKVIETFQENRIMAVAKHFPGIGRTTKDSHFHLPVLDIEPERIESSDMVPFKHAMDCKVSGVMLSHIFYPELDNRWQASLSVKIAKNMLRTRMGYNGLVMTDDLDMKAVQKDIKTCVKQILKADIDMALICHKGPDIDTAFQEIQRLIHTDEDLMSAGIRSVERILGFKKEYLGWTC